MLAPLNHCKLHTFIIGRRSEEFNFCKAKFSEIRFRKVFAICTNFAKLSCLQCEINDFAHFHNANFCTEIRDFANLQCEINDFFANFRNAKFATLPICSAKSATFLPIFAMQVRVESSPIFASFVATLPIFAMQVRADTLPISAMRISSRLCQFSHCKMCFL
jgi:hypothetical protein